MVNLWSREISGMKIRQRKARVSWGGDLEAVQRGDLDFSVFARRHAGVINSLIKHWVSRCPLSVTLGDLEQETLLVIWKSIRDWKPERKVPLKSWVRIQVRWRLLRMTSLLIKGVEKEQRFLFQQVVDERVVRRFAGNQNIETNKLYEAITLPDFETNSDVTNLLRFVIGHLPARQAQVIAGLCVGEDLDTATARVYGPIVRHRRVALRAVAAASGLVESWQVLTVTDRETIKHGTNDTDHAEQEDIQLKPIRKVRRTQQPDARQGQRASAG